MLGGEAEVKTDAEIKGKLCHFQAKSFTENLNKAVQLTMFVPCWISGFLLHYH